jgi:ATP-dependent helicase/nuclease subunit A
VSKEALVDQAARDRIVSQLCESQFVEAAAGTGKTRILVERLVEVIASGRGELANMVVVTFTEKAAGELKLRVREAIEARRREGRDEPSTARLKEGLEQLEDAHISTIHGFCADVLREYPVEAGVDPDFSVQGDEVAGKTLFEQVFERWLEEQQRSGLSPAMDRVLRRRGQGVDAPANQLFEAASRLRDHRDLDAPWEHATLDLAAEVTAFCRDELAPVAALSKRAIAAGAASPDQVQALITLDAERAQRQFEPRDLEARLWSLRRRIFPGRGRGPLKRELQAALDGFSEALAGFRERSGAQLAAMLQRELMPCLEAYEQAKRESGQLDFMDLLLLVRALLQNNATIRRELQRRFSHIFVDEFQDTDPLQAEILLLLASDEAPDDGADDVQDADELSFEQLVPRAGKLFVVGDPKQSIYRFRRADIQLYEQLKRRLAARNAVAVLQLTTSFRAVPALQQAVNAAFEPLMSAQAHQPDYVALSPARVAEERPAIIGLPVPSPYGYGGRISKKAIRGTLKGAHGQKGEPNAVAAWIDWALRQSGWQVSTRGGQREPLAAHHICLLFRQLRGRFDGDLTRPYIQALEARGVPHVVVGGRSYFAREEVDALVTALRVIEWPTDELAVYAALRGPLFGFDDERLYLYRRRGGRFIASAKRASARATSSANEDHCDLAHPRSLLEVASSAEGGTIEAALRLVGALHAGRNHRPLAQTIGSLLSQTRCIAGFALRPSGDQAVASLLRMQELARRFGGSSALSFRAFIEYLEGQIDAELADADNPVFEEGRGGVRMMSVHRAKGLEFPIVILADAACSPSTMAWDLTDRTQRLYAAPLCDCSPLVLQQRQEQESARQAAEELRLLYVAATRARDTLVIPTLPEKPSFESWLDPLLPIVQSDEPNPSGEQAAGAAASAVAAGVSAGSVRPKIGEHRVVYWDLSQLELEVAEPPPLRDSALIRAEGSHSVAAMERYVAAKAQRDGSVERGAQPLCQVYSATVLAHHGALFLPHLSRLARQVAVERVRGPGAVVARPGEAARRFGNLVHGALELLDFSADADSESLARAVSLVGRVLGASDDEQKEAKERIREALAHALFDRLRHADAVYREVPISLRLEPVGEPVIIVEGIADVVFKEGDQLTVVDYKTDAQAEAEQLAAYKRQVAFYVDALDETFGGKAQGCLLFV